MYGHDTNSAPRGSGSLDKGFHQLLENAANAIRDRIERYDPQRDPLKQSHLKILWDIVTIEAERAANGALALYTGLEPPIRAVADWGEPADSQLTVALRDAETFFRRNYASESGSNQAYH
jgi:hypothetical protein